MESLKAIWKISEVELIKMLGEGQSYHFIKLEIKIIFFGSFKSIREEFETFGGNLERFESQKIKKNKFEQKGTTPRSSLLDLA